ncbi:MAG: hypothetical protein O3B73_08240 [bacterium]|jgi:hypothetical protein|nr:hypothetical protein [bacterium]
MPFVLFYLSLLFAICPAHAQPPASVRAQDTPNDAGGSITVTWQRADLPPGSRYQIAIGESADGPFYTATELPTTANLMSDDPATFGHSDQAADTHFVNLSDYPGAEGKQKVTNDKSYYVQITTQLPDGQTFLSETVSAQAIQNLFNQTKFNNFILGSVFSLIILMAIFMARRRQMYIRRIAGLEALDEALGRATEMGKPVFFAHGLQGMGSVSTIAAVNILSRIARRTAEFNTQLRVANNDPVVMAVSQEVVKESYLNAGRPDAYNDDMVFLAATEQFSYAAAVDGMMVRERPAANIMMGYFYAESLLLAETGANIGAIQIAGTDSYTQLPFFITTCDYTLMGEELYAASAYLSREPKLLGSLKGMDIGKAFLIATLVLGTFFSTLGNQTLIHIFTAY